MLEGAFSLDDYHMTWSIVTVVIEEMCKRDMKFEQIVDFHGCNCQTQQSVWISCHIMLQIVSMSD